MLYKAGDKEGRKRTPRGIAMMMKKGGVGGGKTITGLKFESRITLEKAISSLSGYTVKNRQYKKLLAPLNIDVKYVYVLNDWFAKPEYRDVWGYIKSVGCYYFFNELPLDFLDLPRPDRGSIKQ